MKIMNFNSWTDVYKRQFLWSACMLLEHIGKKDVAAKIRKAVDLVLEDGSVLTPDIGGTATTIEYEKAIIAHL